MSVEVFLPNASTLKKINSVGEWNVHTARVRRPEFSFWLGWLTSPVPWAVHISSLICKMGALDMVWLSNSFFFFLMIFWGQLWNLPKGYEKTQTINSANPNKSFQEKTEAAAPDSQDTSGARPCISVSRNGVPLGRKEGLHSCSLGTRGCPLGELKESNRGLEADVCLSPVSPTVGFS